MTTNYHREYSLKQSNLIYPKMLARGDRRLIATSLSGMEVLRRGLLCECAYAEEFGLPLRMEIFEYGDGGIDFVQRLRTDHGVQDITVNVKCKSVQVSWEGLRRKGTVLNVPVRECSDKRIYVFGIYLEQTDSAEVLRWAWGRKLIERNERAAYENGNGTVNYTMPYEDLRELSELHDRVVIEEGIQ